MLRAEITPDMVPKTRSLEKSDWCRGLVDAMPSRRISYKGLAKPIVTVNLIVCDYYISP
jgi:hypothetical protein